jgi:hypothetical protein
MLQILGKEHTHFIHLHLVAAILKILTNKNIQGKFQQSLLENFQFSGIFYLGMPFSQVFVFIIYKIYNL